MRIIGRSFVGDREFCILQVQHATPTGYEIQDQDKRAEYEAYKAEYEKKLKKGNENNESKP